MTYDIIFFEGPYFPDNTSSFSVPRIAYSFFEYDGNLTP